MKRFFLLFLVVAGCNCGDNGGTADGGDAGPGDGQIGDGGDGGDAAVCTALGDTPSASVPCCSTLVVDTGTGKCAPPPTVCGSTNDTCTLPTDCCSLNCTGTTTKTCSATACTQNTQTCSVNTDCCSGICDSSKKCAADPGSLCATTGNACTSDFGCCSGNCVNSVCQSNGSYCTPIGDTCYKGSDCCSSVCTQENTGIGGVCKALTVSGTGGCTMAGENCADCGTCCSRACVPSPTGNTICARASGCALEAELCTKDADCCESGAGACGKVSPGDTYGACRQAQGGPRPGDICKIATPWCAGTSNAPSSCVGCESPKEQCCRVDPAGIPRCFGGSTPTCPAGYNSDGGTADGGACCVAAGNICNFTGECCNNNPCLPDSAGVLRCGTMCAPAGGVCRNSGDCCSGLLCNVPAGQIDGKCGAPTPPPPPDAGVDAGTDAGTPPVCSQLGQGCGGTQGCCSGLICEAPGGTSSCGPTQTGCTCFPFIIM